MAVAVEFVESIERGDVVERGRAAGMARHVDFHPRRQRAEDFLKDLLILRLERGDLGRHIDGLRGVDRTQFVDALLELQ